MYRLIFILSLLAAVLAYAGVRWLMQWIERNQLLIDVPNQRSSHTTPTPKGGGVLIVAMTLTGVIVFNALTGAQSWLAVFSYVLGAGLIAAISWRDDVQELPASVRFSVHIAAAILLILGVGHWENLTLPFLGEVSLGVFGYVITFFVTAGMTNVYNFMDGIDGLAGGQAVTAGLGWTFIGYWFDQPFVCFLGAVVAASSLGFLGHNWPPAKIFMGDVGSAFLGYTFAALTVFAKEVEMGPTFAWVGIFLLWPFLFDATFTILRRLRQGENILQAHRSHLYQRLVIANWPHVQVTVLYIGLTLTGWVVAWLWTSLRFSTTVAFLSVLVLGGLLWTLVVQVESGNAAAG